MKKIIFSLLLFALALAGCAGADPADPTRVKTSNTTGVVLHGCQKSDDGIEVYDGWLENTGDVPVNVRQAVVGSGESTLSFDTLEPGGRLTLRVIASNRGYYIYGMDGGLLDWMSSRCEE